MGDSLQQEYMEYKRLEQELTKSIKIRSDLEAQFNENAMVKQELNKLADGAGVYKLMGPALIKQDLGEAKSLVGKRLEYITAEVKKMEIVLTDIEKQKEIMNLQRAAQQQKQPVAAQ